MSLARCSRCESFFYEDTRDGCRYHSGQYRAWWSCCKEPGYGSRGCRVGHHVEDVAYSRMLDAYSSPAVLAAGPDQCEQCLVEGPDGQVMAVAGMIITQPQPPAVTEVRAEPPAEPSPTPEAEAPSEPRPTPSSAPAQQGGEDGRTVAVPYVVGPHDTFASICLRHRMTAEEVLRLNGLRHRRARVGDVLLVWSERSDAEQSEDLHRQLVRQFRRITGSNAQEAIYYLEMHDYIMGDAVRERERDVGWERERAEVVRVIHEDEASAKAQAELEETQKRLAEAEASLAAMAARRADAADGENALAKCLGGGAGCLALPTREQTLSTAPISVA